MIAMVLPCENKERTSSPKQGLELKSRGLEWM
jgi:hypothetical protein